MLSRNNWMINLAKWDISKRICIKIFSWCPFEHQQWTTMRPQCFVIDLTIHRILDASSLDSQTPTNNVLQTICSLTQALRCFRIYKTGRRDSRLFHDKNYQKLLHPAKDQKSITWFTGEAICDILWEVEELLLQLDSLRGGALPAAPYKF